MRQPEHQHAPPRERILASWTLRDGGVWSRDCYEHGGGLSIAARRSQLGRQLVRSWHHCRPSHAEKRNSPTEQAAGPKAVQAHKAVAGRALGSETRGGGQRGHRMAQLVLPLHPLQRNGGGQKLGGDCPVRSQRNPGISAWLLARAARQDVVIPAVRVHVSNRDERPHCRWGQGRVRASKPLQVARSSLASRSAGQELLPRPRRFHKPRVPKRGREVSSWDRHHARAPTCHRVAHEHLLDAVAVHVHTGVHVAPAPD
mmetsp:Transcript_1694/g.6768  ORF Transcript_1694/g.6768 Transcript_1694/m.6768 type:complete len:257 (+) Transcript_1694:13504-14274(+)